MSKICARCSKTVYPTEELKCLDKVWHKSCFKCQACDMTLNMKNYKGYNKLPYCNAHYPTTKPTAVADTPESRRIAENTRIQSNVQYHADFERSKGQKTSVADDPETARIRQNTQIQSNVNYWGIREQREQMETRRPHETVDDVTRRSRNPGKISDYDPERDQDRFASPYEQRNSANVVYDSQRGEGQPRSPGQTSGQRSSNAYAPFSYGGGGQQQRSSYTDHRSSYGDHRSSQHDDQGGYGGQSRSSYGESQQAPYSYGQPAVSGSRYQPGSIADYDPMQQEHRLNQSYGPPQPVQVQAHQPPPSQPQPARAQPPPKQVIYRAMYDYVAADTDEVSFMDGDHITNVEVVDAGWMLGTVQRTGKHGMLPSNYVERIN